MKKLGIAGAALLPLILCGSLLFFSLVFGLWAFAGRQDYKDNADKKVADAVTVAKQQQQVTDNQAFSEASKSPLKSFTGPITYGSLGIKYPKTWSGYITTGDSSTPVNGYFYPDYIPGLQSSNSFALRIQVIASSYASQVQGFSGQVTSGKVKVTAYTAAKVPGTLGSRVEGNIGGKDSIMVLFPLRDKTIKIWTEADSFKADFTNYVLPSITFSP